MGNKAKINFKQILLNRDILTADEWILKLSVENLNDDDSESAYFLELWELGENGRRIRTYPVVTNFWDSLQLLILGGNRASFRVGGNMINQIEITSNYDPFVSFRDIRNGFIIHLGERGAGLDIEKDLLKVMPPFQAGQKPIVIRIKDVLEDDDVPRSLRLQDPDNIEYEDRPQDAEIMPTTDEGNIFQQLLRKFKPNIKNVVGASAGIITIGVILYFIFRNKD